MWIAILDRSPVKWPEAPILLRDLCDCKCTPLWIMPEIWECSRRCLYDTRPAGVPTSRSAARKARLSQPSYAGDATSTSNVTGSSNTYREEPSICPRSVRNFPSLLPEVNAVPDDQGVIVKIVDVYITNVSTFPFQEPGLDVVPVLFERVLEETGSRLYEILVVTLAPVYVPEAWTKARVAFIAKP